MLRRFLLSALLAVLPAIALAQPTGPVTAQAIRASANCAALACVRSGQVCITGTVMYACDTSTGFYVDVGSIASGSRLNLEGPTGDTYFIRDASVPSLDAYYDGVLRAQIRPTVLAPGNCPTNLDTMETGFCLLNGRLTYRDSTGIYFLVGAVVIQ